MARTDYKECNCGWLPIETAPKDGTHILLYSPGGDGEAVTRNVAEGWWGEWEYEKYLWCMAAGDGWTRPTHWQPLPAPPLHPGRGVS